MNENIFLCSTEKPTWNNANEGSIPDETRQKPRIRKAMKNWKTMNSLQMNSHNLNLIYRWKLCKCRYPCTLPNNVKYVQKTCIRKAMKNWKTMNSLQMNSHNLNLIYRWKLCKCRYPCTTGTCSTFCGN